MATIGGAAIVTVILVIVVTVLWLQTSREPSSNNNRATGANPDGGVAPEAKLVVKPVSDTNPKALHENAPAERPGEKKTVEVVEKPAPLVVEATTLGLAGTSGGKLLGLLSLKSGGPVDRLEFFCSPLRADGDAPPQPAATVVATPEAHVLPSAAQRDVLLDFTLPSVPAGKYSARLFVRYKADTATSASVPVILNVKHNWPWPLFVLLVGVFAGSVVSNYRTVGRPRDEAYQHLGRLKSEIQADVKLAPEFQSYIEQSCLSEADLYVRNGQWEKAGPRLDEAERVWDCWLRYRDQWIELLDYLSECETAVNKMNPRAFTTRSCRDKLDGLRHQVAGMDTPETLRSGLATVRKQLENFRDLSGTLADQEAIRDHMTGDQQADWQFKVDTLRTALDDLDTGNDSAVATFRKSIVDLKPKPPVETAVAKAAAAVMERTAPGSARIPQVPMARQVTTPGEGERTRKFPNWMPKWMKTAPEWVKTALSPEYAGARLTLFYCSAWFATMFVLTWTGMAQLYWSKPTFGSGADYFTLLGWGFGSNASSSTIVQAFNGIPKSAPTSNGRPG